MADAAKHLPLHKALLGPDFERLPPLVREMHQVEDKVEAHGTGRISRGGNIFAWAVASLLRMPTPASNIPVTVIFQSEGSTETITRDYDGQKLVTRQRQNIASPDLLEESFGLATLVIRLEATEIGLTFHLTSCRCLGIPLPKKLAPRLIAEERVRHGKYHYFVQVGLPLVGTLIEYEGTLKIQRQENDPSHFDVI